MKKILFVAGARPNFMKIAPVLRELKKNYHGLLSPVLVHTGQHYDDKMSGDFFETLGISKPDYNLGVGSCSHAEQTAKIMIGFEKICVDIRPDMVVVVGDVNSTIATALVVKKMNIKLAHIEAGLRSGDKTMPEEINRLATDSITDIFFVTEESGLNNLIKEGVDKTKIHFVGHVMIDNLFHQIEMLKLNGPSKRAKEIKQKLISNYACMTLHRPSNVDNRDVLQKLISSFEIIQKHLPIVFPCHPRTESNLRKFDLFDKINKTVIITEPLGYNDFLFLWKDANLVLTDSGGLQEETTALGIPCITIRDNTERPITVEVGTNTLAGTDGAKIISLVNDVLNKKYKRGSMPELWDGKASIRICEALKSSLV